MVDALTITGADILLDVMVRVLTQRKTDDFNIKLLWLIRKQTNIAVM